MDKRMDAADLTAPMPIFRWLVWFRPNLNFVGVPEEEPVEYLVRGTDSDEEAEDYRHRGFSVREDPRWRKLD